MYIFNSFIRWEIVYLLFSFIFIVKFIKIFWFFLVLEVRLRWRYVFVIDMYFYIFGLRFEFFLLVKQFIVYLYCILVVFMLNLIILRLVFVRIRFVLFRFIYFRKFFSLLLKLILRLFGNFEVCRLKFVIGFLLEFVRKLLMFF